MTTAPRLRIGRAALAVTALLALLLVGASSPASARSGPSAVCTPAGADDFYNTDQDTTLEVGDAANGVLGNDTPCFAGDAELVTDVAHGMLNLNADGTFTYAPDAGFSGGDSFVYAFVVQIPERNGVREEQYQATANIFVNCVSDVVDDAYAGPQDTPIAVAAPGVTTNDHLCPGQGVEVVDGPTNGTLNAFDEEGGGFTYTPNAGFVGTDSYTYRAIYFDDGAGTGPDAVVIDIATVRLTINAVVTTTTTTTSTTTTTTTTVPETTTTLVEETTTTTEAPTTTTTTTQPGAVSGGQTALPRTGSDPASPVALGVALVTLGGLALLIRRRRLA